MGEPETTPTKPAASRGRPRLQVRVRIVAAFIVLLTSITMFFLQGFGQLIFHIQLDFDKPAWAFLALAAYVLFGINLSDLVQGRRQEKDQDDE